MTDRPKPTLNRRRFLMNVLGAGLALAVRPVRSETLITTDAEGLLGQMLPDCSAKPSTYNPPRTPSANTSVGWDLPPTSAEAGSCKS